MITVDEMQRAFRFFVDIRTHSDYVRFEDIHRFYQQIDRSRLVRLSIRFDF